MSDLVWRRERDGEHNGKPVYEYHASAGDRRYSIVWAYDHGGTFGYSAHGKDGYLTQRHGIHWGRTLKFCKAACEQLERQHHVQLIVPDLRRRVLEWQDGNSKPVADDAAAA